MIYSRASMTDYEAIYRDHADAYDRMVRAEDCEGNLASALAELVVDDALTAVEVGVGTGRVTEILLELGYHVLGFERAPAMLEIAKRRLEQHPRADLALGDARDIPVSASSADVVLAGWVLGHMTHWEADRWRAAVEGAITEMERVVRPGGSVVVIETLGTGTAQAAPPNEALAAYYALLEGRGYERRVIRTDYQFESPEAAAHATAFFFGAAFAERVRAEGWARIPEHTGIWRRRA